MLFVQTASAVSFARFKHIWAGACKHTVFVDVL